MLFSLHQFLELGVEPLDFADLGVKGIGLLGTTGTKAHRPAALRAFPANGAGGPRDHSHLPAGAPAPFPHASRPADGFLRVGRPEGSAANFAGLVVGPRLIEPRLNLAPEAHGRSGFEYRAAASCAAALPEVGGFHGGVQAVVGAEAETPGMPPKREAAITAGRDHDFAAGLHVPEHSPDHERGFSGRQNPDVGGFLPSRHRVAHGLDLRFPKSRGEASDAFGLGLRRGLVFRPLVE